MVSSILFGTENDPVTISKFQRLSRKRRQRSIQVVGAVPDFVGLGSVVIRTPIRTPIDNGICQPQRPGPRALRNQRQVVLSTAGANKYNMLAIGRPARGKIVIGAGRNVAD